ncbi:MAG: phage regulatory CII family protein [Acidovorax sp.]
MLYNSVRAAPGGVVDAAKFLTERRGRSIHAETLRQRLRGVDGDSISMEMAELLTEWMQDLQRPDALDWLHAFNGRFGLAAAVIGVGQMQSQADAVRGLRDRLLQITVKGGKLTELALAATSDNEVDGKEADALEAQAMEEVRALVQLMVDARVAAGQGGAA